jgi:hypothetical protein
MKRLPFLLLAGLLAMAAGPARNNAEVMPLPPIPPDLQDNSEAAPVPNNDGNQPLGQQGPRGAALAPTLMTPKYTYQGEAFLGGSTVQTEQNRKVRPVPGVNLTVPLQ